jgi:hypothetical protein
MMRTLDLEGIDLDDFDAVEAKWNGWVRELFAQGLRPADVEEPCSTETKLVYRMVKVGSNADLTSESIVVTDAA